MVFAALLALSCGSLRAQKIVEGFAFKMEAYTQNADGAPAYAGAYFSGGFVFEAPRVSGSVVHRSIRTNGVDSMGQFSYSGDGLTISASANGYPTRAILNNNAPNGDIHFASADPFGFTGSLALTGDRYPAGVRVSNFTALQAIAGTAATVDWQAPAGAEAGDVVVVTISEQSQTIFSARGVTAAGAVNGLATRARIEVPPGRQVDGDITILRTTATGDAQGTTLRVGYGSTTGFKLRSTAAPDSTPPQIASVSPALDAAGVEKDAKIQLTFNEPMRPRGILAGPRASQAGARQRVTWSDDQRTATIEFPDPLPNGPVTLTFNGGVFGSDAFVDLSRNPVLENSVAARFFVGVLPAFVRQPEANAILPNTTVTLTASVIGPGTISYQWLRDGLPVPGATGTTLALPNFSMAQAGLYQLRATNEHGSDVSAPVLVVPRVGDLLPKSRIGASYDLEYPYKDRVLTPGIPLELTLEYDLGDPITAYQWRKNGQNIAGATTRKLNIASLTTGDSGVYDVLLTNAYGVGATDPLTLIVKPGREIPELTVQRGTVTVRRGTSPNFQVPLMELRGLRRTWQFNGQVMPGQTGVLSFENVQPSHAGVYRFHVSNGIDTVLLREYTLVVLDTDLNLIQVALPGNERFYSETQSTALSAEADGFRPMTYQWKRNGVNVPGATNAGLFIGPGPAGLEGSYTCTIRNAYGSAEYGPVSVVFRSMRVPPSRGRISSDGVTNDPWRVVMIDSTITLNSYRSDNSARIEWRRDGVVIPNATEQQLQLRNMIKQDAGTYTTFHTNDYGSTENGPYQVIVLGPEDAPYLDGRKISRTVKLGEEVYLYSPFFRAPGLRYRWLLNGREMAAPARSDPGSFRIQAVQAEHEGAWTVEASNAAGTRTAPAVDLTIDRTAAASARLINVSTRAIAGQGAETLIVGFAIGGTAPKRMLLRAVGPRLESFGLTNPVRNPRLTVFRGAQVVASNDDWHRQTGIAALEVGREQAGAYSLGLTEGDAALVATLEPGAYTLQYLNDEGGGARVGLIEAYDLDPGYPSSRITNLSSRLFVGTGERAAIPGLVVRGTEARTYLVRAVGPGLAKFGVAGTLDDPRIEISNGEGMTFLNDNWDMAERRAAILQAAERVGAFVLDPGSKDAALLVTLPAGNYTALVSGASDSTGVALVEVYEVP